MPLIRISGPVAEPVTLEEVKTHLDIDYDNRDEALTAYITAAREKLERRCGRSFTRQAWELRQAEFEDSIDLPLRPVVSVEQITYIDEDGTEQTVDGAEYAFIDGGNDDASSVILTGEWPTDLYDRPDAVRVRFTTGYPGNGSPEDTVANVPDGIKQAIKWLVGHMFENHESVTITPVRTELQELPDSVAAIIAPFIVPRL